MKTTILSLLTLIAFNASAQIPNAGFENWTSWGSYANPDGWATLNNSTASFSLFTATKATPGNPGNSYLKLTSRTIGGSVKNGIAVSGELDTLSLAPVSGFGFTQRPASFGGKWQHMIYGSSQGGISVLLTKWNSSFSKRDTIASGLTTLSGMAMSWANFSFNLTYVDSLHYPDSCIIVLKASGNAPSNNDYLWIDGLAFSGTVAVVTVPPPNPVGLTEQSTNISQITVFPNPSSGFVTLTYTLSQIDKVLIQLIDVNGKVVKEICTSNTIIGSNKTEIETERFAKGIYTLSIKGSNSIQTERLVIE